LAFDRVTLSPNKLGSIVVARKKISITQSPSS
jgi:hypothetical protein